MSYSRIERGPMAADAVGRGFTQIANQVFRDSRLSARAMGVFGHISTHRDGFGITPEAIARHMKDSVDSIKKALRELERYGYLVRTQTRTSKGTLGPSVYRITDMPDGLDISVPAPYPDARLPRSEPSEAYAPTVLTCEDSRLPRSEPLTEIPPTVSPLSVSTPPKKNRVKNTNSENTTSPPPPSHTDHSTGAGAAPSAQGEEENSPEDEHGGVPAPRSAADNDAQGHDGGELAAARELLAGLPSPVTPGTKATRELAPAVAAALAEGWTAESLVAHLAADLPATVRSARALLTHRLDDLPPAPPAASTGGPRVRFARARCDDPRHDPDAPAGDRYLYDDDAIIGRCVCAETTTC